MRSTVQEFEAQYLKPKVVNVQSGDSVKVSQKISEGSKERVQIFEGLVIGTRRKNSLTSTITVRRIASGVGVEKTFLLHSPLITKIEVIKRSSVRRNRLNYMRERSGKSARLDRVEFDSKAVNDVDVAKSQTDISPIEPSDVEEKVKNASSEKDSSKHDDTTAKNNNTKDAKDTSTPKETEANSSK